MKTIEEAIRIYRHKKTSKTKQGLITLKAGTHFLTNTINLTSEDSNLVILGDSSDNKFISGGKKYTFNWKTYVNKTTPKEIDVNLITHSTERSSVQNKTIWQGN